MVLMPYEGIEGQALRQTRDEFDLQEVFCLDQRAPRTIRARLKREFDPYCASTEGVRLTRAAAAALDRVVQQYDLIWFQGISIPNSLGRRSWPVSVLDIDDVPSQVFAGAAKQADHWVSRIAALRKAILWRRRERVLLNRFGIVSVCSDQDKAYLGGGSWIHAIPNGFEAPLEEPVRPSGGSPRIGFIGTLRYAPNLEGLRWFIREAWPLVKSARQDARLRLVGLDTDAGIANEGPDIEGLGFVAEVSGEMAGWAASIVPINRGGGTRVKIAETFSRKCPLVSTRLGAYGYQVETGRDCLLADSPAEMAAACLKLMDQPAYGQQLAERSWQRFCTEWSWDAIAPRVSGAVDACLRRAGGSAE